MKESMTMVDLAKEYLAYRRDLGYKLQSEGPQLLHFAYYADKGGHAVLTTKLAVEWSRLPKSRSRVYWAKRLELVRCFAKYLALSVPATEVPPSGILGPAHLRKEPYIFTQTEIRRLLRAARRLSPVDGLRPKTYACLFGLLSCTGLRISEAIGLLRNDVDLASGVISILESKHHRSRLVPLHPTAISALAAYEKFRNSYCKTPSTGCFFLSERGTALAYSTVRTVFKNLRTNLGLDDTNSIRKPRIHDLRHTFACRRLLTWMRQGVEIDSRIEYLSTYLGHERTTDTYWYLTGTPQLLAIAGKRFENRKQE